MGPDGDQLAQWTYFTRLMSVFQRYLCPVYCFFIDCITRTVLCQTIPLPAQTTLAKNPLFLQLTEAVHILSSGAGTAVPRGRETRRVIPLESEHLSPPPKKSDGTLC